MKKSSNALTLHIMYNSSSSSSSSTWQKVSLSVRCTSQMFGEFSKLAMVS